jgi:SSS family solute:Na+ symporter
MDYIQAIFSWVNAPLFATMLLGMFWKRTTSAGAFWGLLVGMLSSFFLFLALKFQWIDAAYLTFSRVPSDMGANLWRAFWAWSVTFVLTIGISLVTEPKKESELEGLVRGLTPSQGMGEAAWYKQPLVWALVSLTACALLNLYFW